MINEHAQLNLDIARLLWPDRAWETSTTHNPLAAYYLLRDPDHGVFFDYRNWNDLMPLVLKHEAILLDILFCNPSEVQMITNNPQGFLAQRLLAVLQAKQEDKQDD